MAFIRSTEVGSEPTEGGRAGTNVSSGRTADSPSGLTSPHSCTKLHPEATGRKMGTSSYRGQMSLSSFWSLSHLDLLLPRCLSSSTQCHARLQSLLSFPTFLSFGGLGNVVTAAALRGTTPYSNCIASPVPGSCLRCDKI